MKTVFRNQILLGNKRRGCRTFSIAMIFLSAMTLGCTSEKLPTSAGSRPSESSSADLQKASGPALKQIDNADYSNWSRFPIGTKVVRRKTMSNDVGTTVITTTLELKEIKPEAVAVESQITVKRTSDTTTNPPSILDYPKSQMIPADMDAELFTRPLPDAKRIATEAIESFGQSYTATVYEWKTQLESGPMMVKGWFSDEFPGRQIKLEFENPGGGEPFVEEIIELETPKN